MEKVIVITNDPKASKRMLKDFSEALADIINEHGSTRDGLIRVCNLPPNIPVNFNLDTQSQTN